MLLGVLAALAGAAAGLIRLLPPSSSNAPVVGSGFSGFTPWIGLLLVLPVAGLFVALFTAGAVASVRSGGLLAVATVVVIVVLILAAVLGALVLLPLTFTRATSVSPGSGGSGDSGSGGNGSGSGGGGGFGTGGVGGAGGGGSGGGCTVALCGSGGSGGNGSGNSTGAPGNGTGGHGGNSTGPSGNGTGGGSNGTAGPGNSTGAPGNGTNGEGNGTGGGPNGTTGPGNSTGGNGTGPSGGNSTGQNHTGKGATAPVAPPAAPPSLVLWPVYLGVVIALLIGVALYFPTVSRRASRGPPAVAAPPPRSVRDAAAEALSAAAAQLSGAKNPKEVIRALYVRLLLRLDPYDGIPHHRTPEEIRVAHLLPLGVTPAAAEELTRLFEEASYSSHAMGVADIASAQRSLRRAEMDLGNVIRRAAGLT